jgi:hypothetical protein
VYLSGKYKHYMLDTQALGDFSSAESNFCWPKTWFACLIITLSKLGAGLAMMGTEALPTFNMQSRQDG